MDWKDSCVCWSRGTNRKGTAVFGGDVVISGTLHGGSPLDIGTDVDVQGILSVAETIQHAGDDNTKIVFKCVFMRFKRFSYLWGIYTSKSCETIFPRYRTIWK